MAELFDKQQVKGEEKKKSSWGKKKKKKKNGEVKNSWSENDWARTEALLYM